MKTNGQKANWFVDFVLFAGFSIAFLLELTGLPVHQWLGITVGLLAGYHLLVHWDWAESLTLRLVRRITVQIPIFLLVDTGLLIGLFTIVMTGLLISTWLALPLANYAMWENVHVAASIATLLLVVLKSVMHWRRVIAAAYRHIFTAPVDKGRSLRSGSTPVTVDRCELLKLTGQSNRNPV